MTRERSIDLFIMFMNVVAIVVLVGILSAMVTTTDEGNLKQTAAANTPVTR